MKTKKLTQVEKKRAGMQEIRLEWCRINKKSEEDFFEQEYDMGNEYAKIEKENLAKLGVELDITYSKTFWGWWKIGYSEFIKMVAIQVNTGKSIQEATTLGVILLLERRMTKSMVLKVMSEVESYYEINNYDEALASIT